MCIVILSTWHPSYPFILLSNRDEFIDRPTAPADWWDAPNAHVLGGRDLERKEHGTWLAITKQGRIAALTNFREEGAEKAKDKSRGGIVNAFLTTPPEKRETPQQFAHRLIDDFGVNDVGGFSLLFGELRAPSKDGSRPGLSILSNRSASAEDLVHVATTGEETRGLSNSHFGDMSWPKVVEGEKLLMDAIDASVLIAKPKHVSEDEFIEMLFGILSTDKLPERPQGEDWDAYVRQMRKSIFIPPVGGPGVDNKTASEMASGANGAATNGEGGVHINTGDYGTQKQTVILVNKEGKVLFVERTMYDEHGRKLNGKDGEKRFEFVIEGWKD